MPSPLVQQVRELLAAREDQGRPLSAPERAILIAILGRYDRRSGALRAVDDVVDEAEAAIVELRRVCITPNAPEPVRRATMRMLAATRALLDYDPPAVIDHDTTVTPAEALTGRRFRADVDG